MRNLQEQLKKAFCYQKLFWPFTVWINLKNFAISGPSALNFLITRNFFLTEGQNNFGNKYQIQYNEKRVQKIISYMLFNFSGWNLSDGNELFDEFQKNSKVIWILWKNFHLKDVKYYTISSATSSKMLQRQNFNVSYHHGYFWCIGGQHVF